MRRFAFQTVLVVLVLMAGTVGLVMRDHLMPNVVQEPFTADFIFVDKSERRMDLLQSDKVMATYRIALGGNPNGHKREEGDERTPEGRYVIDWRNPKSGYFLSLHISYPDKVDKKRAQSLGVSPGGDIMIHGQPNGYGAGGPLLQNIDWTNGCIAVTNAQMQEIWDSVPDGTPIEIAP